MENKLLIDHFKIVAIGHKISFKTDRYVSHKIRIALLADSDFIQNMKIYFGEYPTVKTIIYCNGMANLDNFLEIGSVRKILETELNNLNIEL